MPRPTVALCWYSRSQYAAILSIMADKERLPPSFDEWRSDALRLERQLEGRFEVRRVPLNPNEFLDWCRKAGVSPDAFARDRYANEGASRRTTATAVSAPRGSLLAA
jgi:hypothetical protein